MKSIIAEKSIYGGMLVDKYFLHIEGEKCPLQVSAEEWNKYKIGDEYIIIKVDKNSKPDNLKS